MSGLGANNDRERTRNCKVILCHKITLCHQVERGWVSRGPFSGLLFSLFFSWDTKGSTNGFFYRVGGKYVVFLYRKGSYNIDFLQRRKMKVALLLQRRQLNVLHL